MPVNESLVGLHVKNDPKSQNFPQGVFLVVTLSVWKHPNWSFHFESLVKSAQTLAKDFRLQLVCF